MDSFAGQKSLSKGGKASSRGTRHTPWFITDPGGGDVCVCGTIRSHGLTPNLHTVPCTEYLTVAGRAATTAPWLLPEKHQTDVLKHVPITGQYE